MTWLVPYSRLTPEQRAAIRLPVTEHLLIEGPAGSGKTQVLVWRADYLRRHHGIDDDKFAILVFTNVLKKYIASGLEELRLPLSQVLTFDAWVIRLYRQHISPALPFRDQKPDFQEIRRSVHVYLERNSSNKLVRFVMVDEGQDLDEICYKILSLVSEHVTVFCDYRQQIFGNGAARLQITNSLSGCVDRDVKFHFRNSPTVARLAAHFIDSPTEKAAYLSRLQNRLAPEELPLLRVLPDIHDEAGHVAAIARERQALNQRVGIILGNNALAMAYRNALKERHGFSDSDLQVALHRNRGQDEYDFQRRDVVTITTFHSGKGLDLDTVILPALRDSAFTRFSDDELLNILFVGISRASQWVYLSSTEGSPFRFMPRLREAVNTGDLILQHHDVGLFGQVRPDTSKGLPNDDDLPF